MNDQPDRQIPDRRRWLKRAARGALATLALGPGGVAAALAQSSGARRGPFGLRLPAELQGLLPDAPLDILSTVETLVALEREADLRRLPQSVLQMIGSGGVPTDPDDLYRVALPRLVALIDRATGRRDGGLGERAGGLLARLHAGEHQVPDAMRFTNGADAGGGGLGLPPIDGPEIAMPRIELPQVEEPVVAVPGPPTIITPRRSTRFPDLADEYPALFETATLREDRRVTAEWHLAMLRRGRARYQAVSARTGVPWHFIGATHGLEASFNFRGHLHNGDFPLSARTRQVPAGRPNVWLPPSDWESSAVDAMRLMGFAGQSDWSLPRTLYRLEAYNGFGYRSRGVPTPYLWSFSNHYERGKFVADGRWSATARSQQCGAAVMLKLLADASDVSFI